MSAQYSPICLVLVLAPIAAAALILAGAPARKTALYASIVTLLTALLALWQFEESRRSFQYIFAISILPDWHLRFALGLDGLSLAMVLLAAIVTVAAIWFTGEVERNEHAFYACLLL